MKLPIPVLLALACVSADLPYATFTTTNRVTNVVAVIRMSEVPGLCPECGAPDHHQQQVAMMSANDVIYANVVAEGRTNTMRVATGPSTNWVQTNVVYRLPGLWPSNSLPTRR